MAPLPQEPGHPSETGMDPVPDDAIVISGISGLMPDCENFLQFTQKIYDKQNLVTADSTRWKGVKHPEVSHYSGHIGPLDKFDAQFFTVFYTLAQCSEPSARKLLEQTYQALFDSGTAPPSLYGKHIGVYVNGGLIESESLCFRSDVPLGLVGSSRNMCPNRVSYWLNLKGPSMSLDGACSGTILAMEKACHAISTGYCEAAIVGSTKVLCHPQTQINTSRVVPMNQDGKTKCYDMNADGQTMSEAINVMYLQKYKDAKRVYAVVRHVKFSYGASSDGCAGQHFQIPRDEMRFTNFLNQFYQEAGVSPGEVEYVEGVGAAMPQADKMELQVLDKVFCKNRTKPLLVGSVTSNVGYTETASSSCSVFKLLSAYQRGEIAATINCDNPRRDVPALQDGRMSIVTENQRFNRTYTAVNSLSVTGNNGHALLYGNYKRKDLSKYRSDIPYLVTISGRQESSVEKIIDDLGKRPVDPEEVALIHNVHKIRIPQHLARGFGIYSNKENTTNTLGQSVSYYDDVKKPLWFVYSGMGSQWVGMAIHLMRVPVFAQTIERCHKIMEPKGIDLKNIITTTDKTIFNNVLHTFVGITAIQIGLTDVLRSIGLVPDKIIGHSLGELGCAYADGCLNEEEVMMMAYIRGLVSTQTKFIHGSMAAIGMGYKSMLKLCPHDIEVACHNSAGSCTISGPSESVRAFVATLTEQKIFAKEVQCGNIPYHSRYIADAGPDFLRMSKEVIKDVKLRSNKWLSTSAPQDKKDDYHSLYSTAEYHANNLLNKVLFEEVLCMIPSNAVLVEIAPHGLLQAILKRALPEGCQHIPLTLRAHSDGALFLLEAVGKLYMEGFDPDISALYPKIEFPVSSETRPLSHLVEFAHAENWKVTSYVNPERTYSSVYRMIVTVEDDEFQYLNGHCINGVRTFPFAALLVAVWDTLSMSLKRKRKEISVQFIDLKIHSQPPLHDQQLLYLTVMVQNSGNFEVFHENSVVFEGNVCLKVAKYSSPAITNEHSEPLDLEKDDIYKLLYEKGYHYKDQFRSIHRANSSMTSAEIEWQNNWVTFLDGILQMCFLRNKHQGLSSPNYIRKMVIDVKAHANERIINSNMGVLMANTFANGIKCGGVTIEDIFYKNQYLCNSQLVALKSLKFVPFFNSEMKDLETSIDIFMKIISENVNKNILTIYYINIPNRTNVFNKIVHLIRSQLSIEVNLVPVKPEDILETKTFENADAVYLHNLISDKSHFEALYKILKPNTFLISHGVETGDLYPTATYQPVSVLGSGKAKVELALFRPIANPPNTAAILLRSALDMHGLVKMYNELSPQQKLIVLSTNPSPPELKGLVQQWRMLKKNVSVVMYDQKDSMDNTLDNLPNMTFCMLHEGVWGNEYYLPTRLENIPPSKKGAMKLECSQPGNLNSLTWVEKEISGNGIDVEVHYAGINVRDAQRAMGEKPDYLVSEGFGMDFSGVTASGERVMGLVAGGAASSRVRVHPHLLWPVPAHWNLEDAATVPLAYAYAFYCLCIKMNVRRGLKILVQGGTGALGQATISIALALGCDVFTTVSDVRKKRFLRKLFPELKDDHIGNSRDSSFEDMVNIKTNGMGCDVIISNNVKGELKHATLRCLGRMGNTFDTAQLDCKEHFYLGMNVLSMERSYVTSNLTSMFQEQSFTEMKKLQLLISQGIARGYVRPLSRMTYAPHETERALRLLAASRHRGRVLLSLKEQVPQLQPRITCSPNHSVMVVCNEEGLGLHFADQLINRGAKNLLLQCEPTSYVNHKLQCWKKLGVHVCVVDDDNLKDQIMTCEGIYVINTEKNSQDMISMLNRLDTASRKFCTILRHFAVISDNISPYKELMFRRTQDGLPSLTLQLVNPGRFRSSDDSVDVESKEQKMSRRNILEAVEKALCCGDNVVMAVVQPTSKLNVMEEVSKIPGVNITNATVDRTMLEQIGVDQGRALELANMLQDKFHIHVSKDALPRMTIGQLKKLKKEKVDLSSNVSGLGAHFGAVEPDELAATCEFTMMPSLVIRTELRNDEVDLDLDYLCIIPGLESRHSRFAVLCERLKLPAVVLLSHNNHPTDNLHEMAQNLANSMMKMLKAKKTFYLLGYEFGVLVALEVAAILESHGKTGTVFMLGGTPQDISKSFQLQFKDATTVMIQDDLIHHMYTLITGSSSYELQEHLLGTNNWREKLEVYSNALRKTVTSTTQYTRTILESAYTRIKLLQTYAGRTTPLKSKVIILQSKLSIPASRYFQHLSKQEVIVHQLNATLAFAHEDLKCSNIINKYLDPKMLEAFENSNQCDTVLINDGEFTQFGSRS